MFYVEEKKSAKTARLDFFLVSQSINAYIINSKIIPGYRTDHSAKTLEVCFKQTERGKGYWKLNTSKDNNYVNIVKKCIAETITTYKTPHFNVQDNVNTHDPFFVSMIIFFLEHF